MSQPLRHLVLFSFRDELSAEEVSQAVARFAALPSQIPAVQAFEWGENVSPEDLNHGYTHCFLLTYADAAARDAYLVHPAHEAFVDFIKPLLTQALVVDFFGRPAGEF